MPLSKSFSEQSRFPKASKQITLTQALRIQMQAHDGSDISTDQMAHNSNDKPNGKGQSLTLAPYPPSRQHDHLPQYPPPPRTSCQSFSPRNPQLNSPTRSHILHLSRRTKTRYRLGRSNMLWKMMAPIRRTYEKCGQTQQERDRCPANNIVPQSRPSADWLGRTSWA